MLPGREAEKIQAGECPECHERGAACRCDEREPEKEPDWKRIGENLKKSFPNCDEIWRTK